MNEIPTTVCDVPSYADLKAPVIPTLSFKQDVTIKATLADAQKRIDAALEQMPDDARLGTIVWRLYEIKNDVDSISADAEVLTGHITDLIEYARFWRAQTLRLLREHEPQRAVFFRRSDQAADR